MKFFSNRGLKFQFSILKNKKVLFLKRNIFLAVVNIKTKKVLFTDSIILEDFETNNFKKAQCELVAVDK